jgi:type VI secretion system FHA domain protein
LDGDPLANSMLAAPMAQPNMAADSDPMRSLNSAPKATAASLADQLPDLQRAFIPPTAIKPPRLAAAVQPPSSALAAHPAASARLENGDALLESFRRGLNAPALELPVLTPELMELVGQILREAVHGTVELMKARNTVKQELHAQVTMIRPESNNPLKFSPNVEVALQHLLAPPMPGFTAGVPAMRDAYDDLRAHHFAFVAGMQAVVEGALQSFEPAALEGRLGERSLLQSLMPASRNARLWEQFVEQHASVRKDASDDFHSLFGRVFVKSYNEHIEGLRKAQRNAARKSV